MALVPEGSSGGTIASEKRGTNGFGYDPIFIPDNSIQTFGEMDVKTKNSYSHRGQSLQRFIEYMKNKEKVK